ncbi:MAG TPA: alpha/beta fold hydrolase [Bauldia sp.]|jgi:pimeloyl-ACP methyl ester carboxylesterase
MRPPILFIHGAFTRARRWRPWLSYFADAGFECLAPSLPAHDPPDPSRLAGLGFGDYLDAMTAACATLDRPPIVIGHSMGGLIAQHVAASTPCAGLVLVSSAAPWRTGTTRRALPYAIPYVLQVLAGASIRANPRAAMDLVLHDLPPDEQRELVPTFAFESGRAYRTMVFGSAPVIEGSVTCPVLCLSGGADRLLKPAVGVDLANFYDADHLIFPGRGHSLVSASLTVAAEVRGWIEGLAERATEASFQSNAAV